MVLDRYLLHFLCVCSCLFLSSCAVDSPSTRLGKRSSPAVAPQNERGEILKQEKITLLDALKQPVPTSGLLERVLRFSEQCLELGDYDSALEVLVLVIEVTSDEPRIAKIRLLMSRAYKLKGSIEDARAILITAPLENLPWLTRETIYLRLAELDALRGNSSEQLGWLLELRKSEAARGRESTEKLFEEFFRGLPDEKLDVLRAEIESHAFLKVQFLMRRAELAIDYGNEILASSSLEEAGVLAASVREKERHKYLSTLFSQRFFAKEGVLGLPSISSIKFDLPKGYQKEEGRIGVLLPLTGPYSDVGEQCLEGILLAASVFNASIDNIKSGVEVVVRDTAGDPARVEEALESFSNLNVSAVIGPVLGLESIEAAKHSTNFRFPLLTLSRREDLAKLGRNIYRFGLTARAEIEILVDYVVEILEVRKIGLLYPRDSFGRKVRSLFWDEVEKRGGEIVAVAGYEAGDTDFSGAVRDLVGYRLLPPEVRETLKKRERLLSEAKRKVPDEAKELRKKAADLLAPDGSVLPPIVQFQALFIPDTYESVALIAPQLAFHGIKGVRLLGLSDWNHPDLVTVGGKYVDGAVFTSTYFGESGHPVLSSFAKNYREIFGHEAGPFAAEAFDVTRLLIEALQRRPEDVSGQLRSMAITGGVSGVVRMGVDRNTLKRPHLLGIHRGRMVSIDEEGFVPFLKVRTSE